MHESVKRRPSILNAIGNTPLVELETINPNKKVRLLAKLESRNPGGSVKDRIALSMIESAEESGDLTKDKIILEATSGNTGIGIAMVGAAKGYRVRLVMSEGVSLERRKILSAYGASFILTPAEKGTDGAIEIAYELAKNEKDKYYLTDQYNNPANLMAHYLGTGPEIWKQTEGKITHFVATMGTTGTLMGVSKRLHELNPSIQVIGVEPYLGHRIQGLKNMKEAYRPGIYDRRLIDLKVNVEDEAAFEMARELAKKEGILAGMSSGAAVFAAMEIVRSLDEGVVVVLLPDGGERYLSTNLFVVPEELEKEISPAAGIYFFNTLTHKYEIFRPLSGKKVKVYSCGPTVDGEIHIGGCRRLVVADLLHRWLEYRGFEVFHVMNITDIDDRTIRESEKLGISLKSLTGEMEKKFLEDVDRLNVKRADVYPRASEHVEDMIALTEKLVERGFAYEKLKSLYFDISKKEGYGKLSGFDLGKIKPGVTTDNDSYEKDSPSDFTLLKRSTLGEIKRGIYYKTKWGNVRPGWHIECAAMAMKYLGENFDIHTSSVDLIFPHHENEIAICESITGKPPANYWLHSELVLVNGKKMSRTLGTAISLSELGKRGYDPRVVRYALISVHYRQPLNFSFAVLDSAKAALERIDGFFRRLNALKNSTGENCATSLNESEELSKHFMDELKQEFENALDDDLNVSPALAAIFKFIRRVNSLLSKGELKSETVSKILNLMNLLTSVLGITPEKEIVESSVPLNHEEIENLVQEREKAREAKDWGRADAIRNELLKYGVIVEDTPQGPRWRKK